MDVISAVAAVLGGLFAGLFAGPLSRMLERKLIGPKLVIDYSGDENGGRLESSYSAGGANVEEIFIRLRVRNDGKSTARSCVAYLRGLDEVYASGTKPTKFFDSIPLQWASAKIDCEPRDIPPGVSQFVNLVGISKYASGWNFKTKELFASHAPLKDFKGTYRFAVLVSGDFVHPATFSRSSV